LAPDSRPCLTSCPMNDVVAARTSALSILILDDEDSLRRSLSLNLDAAGYSARDIESPKKALELIKTQHFDIILCDLRMPEMDGFTFIEQCNQLSPNSAVVLMTGYGNTELALEAMRHGAYDYLSKPFSSDELVFTIRKIEEREQLRSENLELRSAIDQKYNFSNIVAKSKQMLEIFETVKRLANFNTSILISGKSGTGKELLARAIHHNSPRKGKPFVAINCGAIPENLMESELFGHKKGAFTDAIRDKLGLFEEANGGTLFLDEIGEMPLHLQVKLLRALQERQIRPVGTEQNIDIDVRVIAATLRDLEEDVLQGRFRDDLFYRLNVVSIHIPSLKERPEDIPVLSEHFLQKYNKKHNLKILKITPEAMRCLLAFDWRGNIRELENCIERAMVLSDTGEIDFEALPLQVQRSIRSEAEALLDDVDEDNLSIKERTRQLEATLIRKALKQTKGNRTHAAKILDISHRALLYKIKEYGLSEVEK